MMLAFWDHELIKGGEHKEYEHRCCQSCIENELQEVFEIGCANTIINPGAVMIHLHTLRFQDTMITLNTQLPHSEQWWALSGFQLKSHFLQNLTLFGSMPYGGTFVFGILPGSAHAARQCATKLNTHNVLKSRNHSVAHGVKGIPRRNWFFSFVSRCQ